MGAYILSDAATLLARWNRSIPSEDKSKWRDPRVEEGYVRAALAGDPTSSLRQPPSMRIPTGFRLEAYEMSRGRKYWDARDIHVPTLVMRGERDFWSRPADMLALERELPDTSAKRFVTIPGGTHYLANDRPERGRALLIAELVTFVKGQTGGADH
jgi:pimeloyl-ACP methyl ester carboxylesterase